MKKSKKSKITQDEKDTMKKVRARLTKQTGLDIGSGYGYKNSDFSDEPGWFLIVWSDDPNVQYPTTFE
jgi:hypothetical protein